jgi:inorganic pyrophosphatase
MSNFKTLTAMVECPKGYNQKLDYDEKEKSFKLSKIMPAGLVFPFDFGMIPGTKGEDGDPLDIIIISESTGFPGCLVDCRIIGCLQAEQTERDGQQVRNDRFIGIPEVSNTYKGIETLDHIPKMIIDQIESFFKNYNEQAGKKFKVMDRLNATEAAKLLL